LKSRNLPATIFLTTGFVKGDIDITKGCKSYYGLDHLNWEQIEEMKECGISFGAHTHSHSILTEVPLDTAEKEIVESKQVLEERLGEPVRHFAYPLGQPRTFNKAIADLLANNGYDLACSTIWGSDNRNTNMFALQRVRIDGCDSMRDYIDKVNGRWDFIFHFQTRRA
jgi:peptidoglycan/xylan/chitin deacetylase (PgdA/CDA1 family)